MSGWGWLQVAGHDRLSFLHRLSTNDFRAIEPGQGLPTVLAGPTGRVLAFLVAYAGNDNLYLRTEPGRAAAVARYLNSLIFWNDDVQVSDLSAEKAQWGVHGPAAAQAVGQIAERDLGPDVAPYAWLGITVAGVAASLHRGGPLEVPGWTLVTPLGAAGEILAVLCHHLPLLDEEVWQQLRVEQGIPARGHELSEQVTPLEVGLTPAVHFNKGCYTGQEVIARQANYDKVARQLAGLILPPATGQELRGAAVRSGNARPGVITSVVDSPAIGGPIALAIVPCGAAQPGSVVTITHAGEEWPAQVAALPFAPSGNSAAPGTNVHG